MKNKDKNYNERIRLKLCILIRNSGMSVPVLAKKAKSNSLTIYRILNANNYPSKKLELRLCSALDITLEELNKIDD